MSIYFESLRLDLNNSGVEVTIIHPGFIKTPLTAGRKAKMPYMMELDEAVLRDALRADGTARVLDETQTQKVRALIARKYMMSRLGNWLVRVFHLRKKPVIGIAVTL